MGQVQSKTKGVRAKKNSIQISFTWGGKRYRPSLALEPTATNLKYAANLKGEIERHVALGTYTFDKYNQQFPNSRISIENGFNANTTFLELARSYKKSIAHLSAGTKIKYDQALNFWVNKIGHLTVGAIKPSTLKEIISEQNWNAKNRNNMLIPLRGTIDLAYDDEIIDRKPTERIQNAKSQRKEPDPLTIQEVDKVLEYMARFGPQIVNYFEFAFFTGLRPSEMIALRWEDVDFERREVNIRRARTFKTEHETKTKSVRTVELIERALESLKRQKEATFMKNGYVFEHPVTKAPFHEERPLRETYWKPTLRALGMHSRASYQTRHTFATLCLLSQCNPMWVAQQMGHTNMGMLLTVYSKWIKGADENRERTKFEQFAGASNPTSNTPNRKIVNAKLNSRMAPKGSSAKSKSLLKAVK